MSPYQSKAQMRWAFATHQPFAKDWAQKTKSIKRLPQHAEESQREKNLREFGKRKGR